MAATTTIKKETNKVQPDKEIIKEPEIEWEDLQALDKIVSKQSNKLIGQYKSNNNTKFIPTVSPTFNRNLGGVPLGRYLSIVGKEQSFKSTIFLMLAKSVIKAGYGVLYIDSEMTMNRDYVLANGVSEKEYDSQFRLVQVNIMEEMLWLTRQCVENFPNIKLIIVDSLPSLDTKKERVETRNDIEKKNIAGSAYYLSKFLPRLKGYFVRNEVCFAYARQYRSNIGVMYGNPIKESGGLAIDYYSDIKLATSCISSNKILDKGECIGYNVKIKTNKSKVGGVFSEFEIPMVFPKIEHTNGRNVITNKCGVDEFREWEQELKVSEIIKDSGGGRFSMELIDGTKHNIHGREKLNTFLRTNPEEFEHLKELHRKLK